MILVCWSEATALSFWLLIISDESGRLYLWYLTDDYVFGFWELLGKKKNH